MINLLKKYNFICAYSKDTARDLFLKREPNVICISVQSTVRELKKHFSNRIISVDQDEFYLDMVYKNKTFRIFPTKKFELVNTYRNLIFGVSFKDDSSTTDFTINSLYYEVDKIKYVSYQNGMEHLNNKIIKFVGNGYLRIMEDKLRILLAPSLVSILGEEWTIDPSTANSIKAEAFRLLTVNPKRLSTVITKVMLESEKPSLFFYSLKDLGILQDFFPELHKTLFIDQTNKGPTLTLFQHIMLALDAVTKKNLLIRMAVLLHDIGKPYTITKSLNGLHFYQHELVGARIAEKVLIRWGFSRDFISNISNLVKNHLFDANPLRPISSIKKLVHKVGTENIHNLIDVRQADRGGNHKEMNMKYLNKFKTRVNKILEKEAPKYFKLMVSDHIIYSYFEPHVAGLLEIHLRFLINNGIMPNNKKILIEYITLLKNIICPFDWEYLFKTQEKVSIGEANIFANGDLECGVYCDFLCKKNNSTSKFKI